MIIGWSGGYFPKNTTLILNSSQENHDTPKSIRRTDGHFEFQSSFTTKNPNDFCEVSILNKRTL